MVSNPTEDEAKEIQVKLVKRARKERALSDSEGSAQLWKKHDFVFLISTFYNFRQLLDTTLTLKRMKNQEMKIFNKDGTVRETELKIMNFRPMGTNKNSDPDVLNKQWEEVVHFFF